METLIMRGKPVADAYRETIMLWPMRLAKGVK